MNIYWKILNLKRISNTGLVIEVIYEIVAKQGSNFETKKGKLTLTRESETEGFVPFEQLTETLVIQWVKNNLGNQEVNTIENNLLQKLQEKINLKQQINFSLGLPWKI